MLHARWEWLYVVALAGALFGGCRCGSNLPASNADAPGATPDAPPAAGQPTELLESQVPVIYPELLPLRGGAPLIRPVAAVALPPDKPAGPTARIAVSGWRAGSRERLLQLVDIDRATVLWSVPGSCRGDVRSASKDHLVCSASDGSGGIDVVDVGSGARLWSSPLRHVASGEGVVVAADQQGIALLDTATGQQRTPLRAPVEFAGEIRRVCRDVASKEVTLVGWNDQGAVAVYDVADDGAVERRWDMQLPSEVLRDHVCQGGVMLFSFRRNGQKQWARYSAKDGRFIAESPTGVDRVGLESSDFRVVERMSDGTLELADIYRGRVVLTAPVQARQVFVGAANLAAVGRRGVANPADRLNVYRLPAVEPGSAVPTPAAPVEVVPAPVPAPEPFAATAVLPDGANLTPAAVSLVGDAVWMAVDGGDSAEKDVERQVVSFDLGSGTFGASDRELCAQRGRAIAVTVVGGAYACATGEIGGRGFLRGRAKAEATPWALGFSTLDDVRAAAGYFVASAGPVAVVVRPDTGAAVYRTEADNGFAPRFAGLGALIVHVEPGRLVARDPAKGGAAVWQVGFAGYPVALAEVGDRVVVGFRDGSAVAIAADGAVSRVDEAARFRGASGALWFDGAAAVDAAGTPVLAVRAHEPGGAVRFETHIAIHPAGASFAPRAAGVAVPVVVETRGQREASLVVLEARGGGVVGAVRLPPGVAGTSFVTGEAVGVVTARPLAVHTKRLPAAASP